MAKGHRGRLVATLSTPRPPGRTIFNPTFLMKRIPVLFLAVTIMTAFVHAEDSAPGNPPAEADTYIPGTLEVPAFVPPAPVEPKVPLTDAEATIVVRDENGQTTTLQRGQASMAPDLPEPEPTPEPSPIASSRPMPKVVLINLGGTVYDHRVSVVHWQNPLTREAYEAVLGFDISLVAPIHTFIREGVTHRSNLFLSHSDTTNRMAQRLAALGRPIQVPEIAPDAYRLTKGDPADPAVLAPIVALRDLYLSEKPRLEKLRDNIAEYQADAKAWADANPPVKEAPVFWFKPHRNSRYLTEQDKADQQQAADERAQQEGEQP